MNYQSSSPSRNNTPSRSNYRCDAYHPGDRQPLSFPKEVLETEVHRVREFWDQKQLYYFLTWSSKMQLIDDEFKHYRLFSARAAPSEVIIFNAELHDIATNAELFVVALPTAPQPKGARFVMRGFMDAARIASEFGIARRDLPVGSRSKHGHFAADLARCQLSRAARHEPIRDISRLHLERPQQYKKEKEVLPSALTHNVAALNEAIAAAIAQVQSGALSLISTLRIDRKRRQIECVPLIPIKVAAVKQWMAVSFRRRASRGYGRAHAAQLEITSLYTNCYDVVSKAALVSPDNVYALHWLTGDRPGARPQAQVDRRLRDELAASYQAQDVQRQLLGQHMAAYQAQLGMLIQKEQQVAALQAQLAQAQLAQAKQQQQQAYIAMPVLVSQPMAQCMAAPASQPVTPSWQAMTPPASPSLSYSVAENSPSPTLPSMMTPLLLQPFDSARSDRSALSGVSDLEAQRTPSPPPKMMNSHAAEYVPDAPRGNAKLLALPTVLECRSLSMGERV